jgi:4-amino-4-deoxy-L-arabinose transferase-like glycosyltransferase
MTAKSRCDGIVPYVTISTERRRGTATPKNVPWRWALVAFLLTLGFALYLQPQWEPVLDDQADYLQLAQGVAARAEFTRAAPAEGFIAEPHRRPGYPLFLAVLCRTVGCDHWQIAIAQAALFAATVLLTYSIAAQVGAGSPVVAAAVLALYVPMSYYAALAMSETLAVFLLVAATYLYLRARIAGAAWAFAAGAACGFLALTRPVFTPLPALFVAAELFARPALATGRMRRLVALLLGAALFVGPFLGYSFANFGNALGGTSGTVRFSGYLQGKVSGSAADLDGLREAALADAADARVAEIGARVGLDAVESVEVAGAYREVAVFSATAGQGRLTAFITLQDQLGARADRLVAHDPVGYALRGLTIRTLSLWATDVPVRADQLGDVPVATQGLLIAVELVAFLAAVAGAVVLVRARGPAALLVAGVFLYVWLLSLPFLTEGRYAIPARPFMAIALLPVVARLFALRLRDR